MYIGKDIKKKERVWRFIDDNLEVVEAGRREMVEAERKMREDAELFGKVLKGKVECYEVRDERFKEVLGSFSALGSSGVDVMKVGKSGFRVVNPFEEGSK